jgi:2-phosphoglycerate kinase
MAVALDSPHGASRPADPPPHAASVPSSEDAPNASDMVKAKTSKYDFVKVRIWLDDGAAPPATESSSDQTRPIAGTVGNRSGHYHVLSRYLVARSLTTALLPKSTAIRISLLCKKRLVDSGRLDITTTEWRHTLEQVVREENLQQQQASSTKTGGSNSGMTTATTVGLDMQRFKMIQWFQASRTPLIVLLYGNASIGQSTVATKLGNHLNLGCVLQGTNVWQLCCSIDQERKKSASKDGSNEEKQPEASPDDDIPSHLPLHLHPFSSSVALELGYTARTLAVRKALQQDLAKIVMEGRSAVVEGCLIDPNLFDDMLPDAGSRIANSPGSSPTATADPILLSFHATLPPVRQQLILHNQFAGILSSPPTTVHPTNSQHQQALPSPAVIWRNLKWLEEIIQRRHEQWMEKIAERDRSVAAPMPSSSSSSQPFLPPRTVSLDPAHTAADIMHAAVLEAMQSRAQQKGVE